MPRIVLKKSRHFEISIIFLLKQGTALEKPTKPERIIRSEERKERNICRGVSQGVHQAAVNDHACSRLHTHYSQTEITTLHMKYQSKAQLWKKTTKPENYQIRRAKRNIGRSVSQGVYQAAVNDEAGSRSHTHYSQTEITKHHMEYQNKVQLRKKTDSSRELSDSKERKETSVEVSAKEFIKLR